MGTFATLSSFQSYWLVIREPHWLMMNHIYAHIYAYVNWHGVRILTSTNKAHKLQSRRVRREQHDMAAHKIVLAKHAHMHMMKTCPDCMASWRMLHSEVQGRKYWRLKGVYLSTPNPRWRLPGL